MQEPRNYTWQLKNLHKKLPLLAASAESPEQFGFERYPDRLKHRWYESISFVDCPEVDKQAKQTQEKEN